MCVISECRERWCALVRAQKCITFLHEAWISSEQNQWLFFQDQHASVFLLFGMTISKCIVTMPDSQNSIARVRFLKTAHARKHIACGRLLCLLCIDTLTEQYCASKHCHCVFCLADVLCTGITIKFTIEFKHGHCTHFLICIPSVEILPKFAILDKHVIHSYFLRDVSCVNV